MGTCADRRKAAELPLHSQVEQKRRAEGITTKITKSHEEYRKSKTNVKPFCFKEVMQQVHHVLIAFSQRVWLRPPRREHGHEEHEDGEPLQPERKPGRNTVAREPGHHNQLEATRGGLAETPQRAHDANEEDHEESSRVLGCRKTKCFLLVRL